MQKRSKRLHRITKTNNFEISRESKVNFQSESLKKPVANMLNHIVFL